MSLRKLPALAFLVAFTVGIGLADFLSPKVVAPAIRLSLTELSNAQEKYDGKLVEITEYVQLTAAEVKTWHLATNII